MEYKICTKCKKKLSATDKFFPKNKRTKDELGSWCRECHNKNSRQWRIENRDKYRESQKKWQKENKEKWNNYMKKRYMENKERQRDSDLKHRYGISIETYNILYKYKKNRCWICGCKEKYKHLAVDHDHKTGKVRGLLCENCNKGLGLFMDNPLNLIKAAKYLKI